MAAPATDDDAIDVRENSEKARFEIWIGDALAGFTEYRVVDASTYTFFHTEVDDAYEGRGLASRLIRAALDQMLERGVAVRPTCPFVKRFIQRHEDYQVLVPEAERQRFGLS